MSNLMRVASEVVVQHADVVTDHASLSAAAFVVFSGVNVVEAPAFDEGRITWQKSLRDTVDEGLSLVDVAIEGIQTIRKGVAEDWRIFGTFAPEGAGKIRRIAFYLTHLKSDLYTPPDAPRCIWRSQELVGFKDVFAPPPDTTRTDEQVHLDEAAMQTTQAQVQLLTLF